jgi:predicted RNase H-like HicB family nuclease
MSTGTMLRVEIEQEADGRWIAEIPELPGVLAYGATPAEARAHAVALGFRVIADRIEQGEPVPAAAAGLFAAA